MFFNFPVFLLIFCLVSLLINMRILKYPVRIYGYFFFNVFSMYFCLFCFTYCGTSFLNATALCFFLFFVFGLSFVCFFIFLPSKPFCQNKISFVVTFPPGSLSCVTLVQPPQFSYVYFFRVFFCLVSIYFTLLLFNISLLWATYSVIFSQINCIFFYHSVQSVHRLVIGLPFVSG